LKINLKKTLVVFLLCPIILISYLYCAIPSKVKVSSGSSYSYGLNPLVSNFSEAGILTGTNTVISKNADNIQDKYTLSLKLFNTIPIKNINVEVAPKVYVYPCGEPIGVKMYTDGILIVGISYVINQNGQEEYPAKTAGIKEGDIIRSINGYNISSTDEMAEAVNSAQGRLNLSIERNNEIINVDMQACMSSDGDYKMGIWVRDTAAGIGTMTFYNPQTHTFASLGHAITDIDTGDMLKLLHGDAIECRILSVNKGSRGCPGELIGAFTDNDIGDILINDRSGVYGKLDEYPYEGNTEPIPIATRFEINEGPAYILSDVDGTGVKLYSINILRFRENQANKGIVFKVTDEKLLEKTGGIVQGMSGSPIIQNNMLIGAVTHVFINDPEKGYGIFAENMLDEINKIK